MDIGSTVNVKVRNPLFEHRDRYGFHQREFYNYTGTVVEHDDATELALTTGITHFPVRVIRRENIVECDNQPVDPADRYYALAVGRESWTVKGSKGDSYVVTRTDNHYSCTCKGFMFRRDCRHIREIKNDE